MISPLALLLAGVLGVIALLHLAWGLGLNWPGTDRVSLAEHVGGVPPGGVMHPLWMCATVAFAIAMGAVVILAFSAPALPMTWRGLATIAYAMLAGVFIGRGLAGFFPRFWRHTEGTPFHRLNRQFYSPLCLLIAGGMAVNFLQR